MLITSTLERYKKKRCEKKNIEREKEREGGGKRKTGADANFYLAWRCFHRYFRAQRGRMLSRSEQKDRSFSRLYTRTGRAGSAGLIFSA